MEQPFIEDKTFEKIDYTSVLLKKAGYQNCSFVDCNFSYADLGNCKFYECTFTGCNLSMAKLPGTVLQEVKFRECKMLGLEFERCDPFGLQVGFDHCNLTHASFYQARLKKTGFQNCLLHETDFTEADLTGALFDQCDLGRARFVHTILEKADLRTSFQYSIDPELNKIKKARFSLPGITGLLDKYDIRIDR